MNRSSSNPTNFLSNLDVTEKVLTFLDNKDIRSFTALNNTSHEIVTAALSHLHIHDVPIFVCVMCGKYTISTNKAVCTVYINHPSSDADAQARTTVYIVCGRDCRVKLINPLPRCHFCLCTVKYSSRLTETLFCSQDCCLRHRHGYHRYN